MERWKVFDLDDATRVHASEVLRRVPDRPYGSADDVLKAARSVDPRFRSRNTSPVRSECRLAFL